MGMKCVKRKEEIVKYTTKVEGTQYPRPRRVDWNISQKDMKTLMRVGKRWRPLTMDIFGRCVNMHAGC